MVACHLKDSEELEELIAATEGESFGLAHLLRFMWIRLWSRS